MVGQRFGRLVVESFYPTEKRGVYWLCSCDCGKKAVVRGGNLRMGHTKSCGCLHDELSANRTSERNRSHGESESRLYGIWTDMRKRCTNSNHWAYARYGGRGVSVCDEWTNYEKFAEWSLQNGYTDELTLDRIDNNGDYSPHNCRWATRTTQARNRSSNKLYTYNGATLTIPEWSEVTGINQSTLYGRLTRYGWTIERALSVPPRGSK